MFKACYYYGERFRYWAWVASKEDAKLEAMTHPNPPIGLQILTQPAVEGNPYGNGYSYYLVGDCELKGVAKSVFMEKMGF